jgi:peptidoglycan/LPS O-acetylase OafA/YrhL
MDGAFREGASAPYWSLALEEQFYLALPLLVFAAGRHLTAVLLALTALMFVLPEDTMYFGVLRIQPILLGVLLAVLARDPIYRLMQPSWLGRSRLARRFCLAMLLFWLASLAPLRQTILPYRFDAIAVISVLLVFIASYDQGYICAEGSLKRVLVWFGSRSYALYLVHVPVFCATRELFTRLNPPDIVFDHRFLAGFLLVGLGATLVLAELNYRCVEQPLRRRGKRAGLTFEQKHAVLFQKNRPPDSGASCA